LLPESVVNVVPVGCPFAGQKHGCLAVIQIAVALHPIARAAGLGLDLLEND
jgi:hypothetical protein